MADRRYVLYSSTPTTPPRNLHSISTRHETKPGLGLVGAVAQAEEITMARVAVVESRMMEAVDSAEGGLAELVIFKIRRYTSRLAVSDGIFG